MNELYKNLMDAAMKLFEDGMNADEVIAKMSSGDENVKNAIRGAYVVWQVNNGK